LGKTSEKPEVGGVIFFDSHCMWCT